MQIRVTPSATLPSPSEHASLWLAWPSPVHTGQLPSRGSARRYRGPRAQSCGAMKGQSWRLEASLKS